MGTSVIAAESALVVEPGSTTSTELRVRNNGDVVDQISFQPLGDHTSWISVEPPVVRLFPGTEDTVMMTVSPPRDPASAAGTSVWGVKAMSSEAPDASSVAEGTLDVGEFRRFEAELVPSIGHGRRSGAFQVAVDNLGNTTLPIRLTGADAAGVLDFGLADPSMVLSPGSAQFTKLKVRPPKRIWRGAAKSYPFELLVEPQIVTTTADADPDTGVSAPDVSAGPSTPPPPPTPSSSPRASEPGGPAAVAVADGPPAVEAMTLTGTYVQVPILPAWFFKAALALGALAVALWIAWQLLVKPNVESAAREIAVDEVEEVAEEVAMLDDEVEEVADDVGEVAADAADAAEDVAALEDGIESGEVAPGGGGGASGSLGGTLNDASTAMTFRVEVAVASGQQGSGAGPIVESDHLFALTDMVLQNPGNDSGEIEISIGADPLLVLPLQSFRTLDFHTIAPHVVPAGQQVVVNVRCVDGPVAPTPDCSSAVLFSGFLTPLEPDTADT